MKELNYFLKNKNKKNYDKFACFLNKLYTNNKTHGYSLFVTDNHNTLIYSSTQINTWENYTSGKILFDNIGQSNILNVAKKTLCLLDIYLEIIILPLDRVLECNLHLCQMKN